MTPLERLGANDLRAVLAAYRQALRAHQEQINRLNVYPVPDGDTGTNMGLTVQSVLTELDGAGPDMAAVCTAIAHGSLMGARGNSGVILSQILRGMTTTFAGAETIDGPTFARGLAAATDGAYKAVGRPVEGTILTVVREAAEAAAEAADGAEASLSGVVETALVHAGTALERTPELLEVLREAGVVDAGGAGFLLLLDAALCVVAGRPLPEPAEVDAPRTDGRHAAVPSEAGVADLRYEVMYLLEAPDEEMPAFREAWAAIGDSIVVVGGEGIWNCHIHSDDVGAAIEAGIDAGRPRQIRVTDLAQQMEDQRCEAEEGHDSAGSTVGEATTAVVAVASGDGLRKLFRSLGAGHIVAGGQSMNPSTGQLLEAVQASAADQVVILPNNANIVAVAERVDDLTAKVVRVVATHGIAEGLAALLAYDRAAAVDDNVKAMGAAAGEVVAGEVTRAVRSSTCEAGPISEGDWLGIGPAGILAVEGSAAAAAIGLLDALVEADHELVIVIEGEDATAGDTTQITGWLAEHRPGLDVEVHHGGQPLYPYLIGIE
ncbi:MAG: DAK2 domain-containing protein [Acidimicrobiales bacterium]